jgi:23S rRNA pseudouridine2605 synthase
MEKETENLLGVLIEAGIDSRRKLAAAIMQGRVMVNGRVASDLRCPVDREKDRISIDGQEVELKKQRLVYLMLNKPKGVLSTVRDERGRKTVRDFIPEKYSGLRLYPAGRLDRDTTGLLLLTNDGELTHRLTHPGFENEKEYWIQINGVLKPEEMKKLEKGIELEDGMTAPAKVKKLENNEPFNYSIIIHEGRKRQVRRMFSALGYRTLALKRVRIGKLTLGELKEGEVRELSEEEVGYISNP